MDRHERDRCDEALRQDARHLQEALRLDMREARTEAELLLMHALGIGRAQLIAYPERAADAATNARYRDMLARRLAGVPVAYIVGTREFYGLEFEVSPAVLVPRPDTEVLVDCALERLPADAVGWIADLGTGSGCIAIAIAKARPGVRVLACDLSEEAVQVAMRNAERHAAHNVTFVVADWLSAIAPGSLGMIVSNPPYIRLDDTHLRALCHEPRSALVSGVDGLFAWRTICAEAMRCLAQGGWLLMEHGYDQGAGCCQLLCEHGFDGVFSQRDISGHPRVSGGYQMQ